MARRNGRLRLWLPRYPAAHAVHSDVQAKVSRKVREGTQELGLKETLLQQARTKKQGAHPLLTGSEAPQKMQKQSTVEGAACFWLHPARITRQLAIAFCRHQAYLSKSVILFACDAATS
jgi:hypothetical protein